MKRSPRAGFTLVEMLVATALVVLIMLMFATIFGMATNSMSKMRGMAELDQGARTITTVLANDLHNRTFRDVMPFRGGQNTDTGYGPGFIPERRQGYLYISENQPRNDWDDVLQFTVNVNNSLVRGTPFARGDSNPRRDPSRRDPLLYGKTVQLAEPEPDLDPSSTQTINQPEFDDGSFGANGLGASPFAEVSYFLRNGNLYRRVLLVRQPYDESWMERPDGINGPYGPPYTSAADEDTENGTGEFWRDFDYSAFYDDANSEPLFSTAPTSLRNTHPSGPLNSAGLPLSLGIPHLRFGHTLFRNDGSLLGTGLPREFLTYADTANPSDWPFAGPQPAGFIGRFTVHECSHDDFDYPGRIYTDPTSGTRLNPLDPATPLSFDARYHVNEYAAGNSHRRGDDLLMSNVHGFDVKVWDDVIGEYLDLGHERTAGGIPGRYHRGQNLNVPYGNRFDTWHPTSHLPNPPYFPSDAGVGGTLGDADERPLRGIRITVRYQDVSTGSMRTLVRDFPLVDPGA